MPQPKDRLIRQYVADAIGAYEIGIPGASF